MNFLLFAKIFCPPPPALWYNHPEEGFALNIAATLLTWYDQHARTLPWRGIHDPYRTWVSETMLQQT